ncbi:MAG: hypothetical protein QW343_03585 [Candidatus Norongarragalinales archaeon]
MARKKKRGLARRLLGATAKYSLLGVKAAAKASLAGAKLGFNAAKLLVCKSVEAVKKTKANATRIKNPPKFKALREVEALSGTLADFEDFVYDNKSTIGIIIGARGSGKSVLGMRLLENAAARGRKVATIGFDESALPRWIRCVKASEISDVSNGSFLLVDEGGIAFSSRDSMSNANKLLSDLLFVSRHKDFSVIFISQNSANLEVNALRQADYLLFKRPSLLQRDFERKKINELYDAAAAGFKKHGANEGKALFYCYSDAFVGFAVNEAPSFWSERASKSFAKQKLG